MREQSKREKEDNERNEKRMQSCMINTKTYRYYFARFIYLIQYLIATTTQNLATAHNIMKGRDTDVYSLTQSDNVNFCQDSRFMILLTLLG